MQSEREPAKRDEASDARTESLLREMRDVNRALRVAITELTAEMKSARTSAAAAQAAPEGRPDHPTPEQWAARLRAREPDLVMETVCRLRERMLTRAMEFDRRAERVAEPFENVAADELQQALRVQEQEVKRHRKSAETFRAADRELDGVRTLESLARWRVSYADIVPD